MTSMMWPNSNDMPLLERKIGETVADTVYALARGISEHAAGRPVQEGGEIIEYMKKLDALSGIASAARISFTDAACQHGIAVMRERLGPNFDSTVIEQLVKGALLFYEEHGSNLLRRHNARLHARSTARRLRSAKEQKARAPSCVARKTTRGA